MVNWGGGGESDGTHLGDGAAGSVPAGLLGHFLGQSGQCGLSISPPQDIEAPQQRSPVPLPLLGALLMVYH